MFASYVRQAQREAESMLMPDACTVTKPGEGTGPFNEDTGQYEPPPPVTVYTGRCRVKVASVAVSTSDAGEREWTLQRLELHLPVSGSEGVRVGHTATVDVATLDAALQGRAFRVVGLHAETHATARRLEVEESA